MKKKILIVTIVFICCFIGIFVVTNFVTIGSKDRAVFKDRVYKYLTAPSGPDFSTSEQQRIAKKNLLNFTEEFPASIFADDAQFIPVAMGLSPSDEDVVILENLIERYPNGKIEDYTMQYLQKFFSQFGRLPAKTYMPYDLVLVYLKGQNAFRDKNYNVALEYFSEFIKRIDENNSKTRKDLFLAYELLLFSYKHLDRRAEGEEIRSKMLSIFPEEKDKIERFWSLPVPK